MKPVFVAAALASAAFSMPAAPAAAWGDLSVAPERPQVIHHRAYRPYYRHVHHFGGDPYAYRYVRRPWYPSYNSTYWVPAEAMRYRYRYTYDGPKYRYYPAWGYPKYRHRGTCGYDCRPTK